MRRCLRNTRNRNRTQTSRESIRNCMCKRVSERSPRIYRLWRIIHKNHKIHTQGIHNTKKKTIKEFFFICIKKEKIGAIRILRIIFIGLNMRSSMLRKKIWIASLFRNKNPIIEKKMNLKLSMYQKMLWRMFNKFKKSKK